MHYIISNTQVMHRNVYSTPKAFEKRQVNCHVRNIIPPINQPK